MKENVTMETIFDFNPTDKELKRFGGREQFEKAKKYGIDPFGDEDTNNYQLGLLFSMRGNKEKAEHYWNQLKNKNILKTLIQDF